MFTPPSSPFTKAKKKPAKSQRSNDPGKERAEWKLLDEELEELKQTESRIALPGTWTIEDYNEFVACITELIERDSEAINLYSPLEKALIFHNCLDHEVGLSGSNRAGKTCSASAEVAMAALGVHYIEGKYPKENCQIACIGNDGRHLSLMYKYLFEKAMFKVYQHPITYEWHVVEEDNPEAQKYKELWTEAKPMIPERMIEGGIEGVSWENKKERIPQSVRLTNGTLIRFFSALVKKVPAGIKFDLVWMDEEITQAKRWIDEMRARIIDLNGRIIWSATPQNHTEEFRAIMARAEDPENEGKPPAERAAFFVMKQSENKYISKEGSAAFVSKIKNDEEQMMIRYFGDFSQSLWIVYPEFGSHNIIDEFNLHYEDTRYIIIDPGVDVAAVLFLTCPFMADDKLSTTLTTQEKWYRTRMDCMVCYDELYIRRANPDMVAQAIKTKLAEYPTSWIQDFTIDQRGGRSMVWRGMGANETCEGLYMQAIKKYDIVPRNSGWKYGSPDVKYGIEKTKGLLIKDFDQIPKLFIHRRCKKLIHEFKYWRKTRDVLDNFTGYEKGNNHLLDCVRYGTTRELKWVPPPESMAVKPLSAQDYQEIMKGLRTGFVK